VIAIRRIEIKAVVVSGVVVLTLGLGLVGCGGDTNDAGFQGVSVIDPARESSATVECTGATATLEFDPGGRAEARLAGGLVGLVDPARRGLNLETCAKVPAYGGGRVLPYERTNVRTLLTCRIPGRFGVDVRPASTRFEAENGSSISFFLRTSPVRTLILSAVVANPSGESSLSYAPSYCTAS
jgi:hypothetical protein